MYLGHCVGILFTSQMPYTGSVLSAQASEIGHQTLLLFVELLETRRAYLGNLTPIPALPALLLTAERVDADSNGQRFLVDGWLLLRIVDPCGLAVSLSLYCRAADDGI